MTGSIRNTKTTHLGGFISYRLVRNLPNGRQYIYVLHLSSNEVEQGRSYVAMRVRRARADMRENLQSMIQESEGGTLD